MNAILIIVIALLMSGGTDGYFIDYELRIPQKDILACEEAARGIRDHTHTNNNEYEDEYTFKIRNVLCVDK